MHLLFRADVVGFVEDCLLLFFGHCTVSIHRRLVQSQRHTKPYWDFIEIHNYFSLRFWVLIATPVCALARNDSKK